MGLTEFVPYAPGNRTVDVIRRIRDGKAGSALSSDQLQSLNVPQGNADRVQRALMFLGLISSAPDFTLSESAVALRKAHGDAEYQRLLGDILKHAYAGVFEIVDLTTVSRTDLVNAFRRYDPAGQRDNMISLYVALCREAGLMPSEPEPIRKPQHAKKGGAPSKPTATPKKRFVDSGGILHPVIDVMLSDVKQKFVAGKWTKQERDKFAHVFPIMLDTYLPVSEETKEGED